MSNNERWHVYDDRGRKVGEVRSEESGGGGIVVIVAVLVLLLVGAMVSGWISTFAASINGNPTAQWAIGLAFAFGFAVNRAFNKIGKPIKFWKRTIALTLVAGLLSGLAMCFISLLGEYSGVPSAAPLPWIFIMIYYAFPPAVMITALNKPAT